MRGMKDYYYRSGKFHIMLQTLAILAGMAFLFGLLGWMLFGVIGLLWALIITVVLFFSTPKISPWMVLRIYRARMLLPDEAPKLHEIVSELSSRARLPSVPQLSYVPSRVMNAFSVGSSRNSAIAISDGIIRHLSVREIVGVLAHEISHIRNNDLKLLALADLMTRITYLFSFFGQILIVFYLPLAVFSETDFPLGPILLLIFAPTISMLLQLALSRTREFDADLGAAELTGDPAGLASALQKMDHYEQNIWDLIFFPRRKQLHPSLLRTHPHTKIRLEKLESLAGKERTPSMDSNGRGKLTEHFPQVDRIPKWSWLRRWY